MAISESHGIPWQELIVPQVVNVTVFAGLLIYFIRKPIQNYFSGRSELFEQQKRKAEEIRLQAEKLNKKIRSDLEQLETTAEQTLITAKKDAEDLNKKMISDAGVAAKRIKHDAEQIVHFEYLRSMTALKQEFALNATNKAQEELRNNNNENSNQVLDNEFLEKVRMVRE